MGIINTIWISGKENPADLYTKNLAGPDFEKHTVEFCGPDEYYKNIQDRESVGM